MAMQVLEEPRRPSTVWNLGLLENLGDWDPLDLLDSLMVRAINRISVEAPWPTTAPEDTLRLLLRTEVVQPRQTCFRTPLYRHSSRMDLPLQVL